MALESQFPIVELINALNGFSGTVIQWDRHHESFVIADNAFCQRLLHPADVNMTKRFLTIASDYRSLRQALRDTSATHCPYRGALVNGIEKCFHRYDQQLNQLEDSCYCVPDQGVSSLLTMLQFEDVICQLWKLWRRLQRKEMTFNELMSHVYKQMDAGSGEWRSCFQLVFHSLINAVYDDIWSWLMFGHLAEESAGSFFIVEAENDVQLQATDLPDFVDNVLALKILFTGKLIRSLSILPDSPAVFAGKEHEFSRRFFALKDQTFDKFSFGMFVESMRKEAAKFSSQYVIQKEGILRHFSAIKQIFLTGNENLWIFFVDKVSDLTDRKCDSWSSVRRDKYIRSVIESILLKSYCNDDEVDSFLSDLTFDFKCTSGKPLPTFTVDYKLPPLTERIVKSHMMEKYQRVMNFMLQLFLVRQELTSAWRRDMRRGSRMWFIRHKLLLFTNHLSFYLKVSVFETQMTEFLREITISEDYEEMQLRHASFVSTLMREMFLDYEAVEKILLRVFDFVHNVFQDSVTQPSDEEVKKHDDSLSKMLHELDLLFRALRDFRFHSSLCQLLLKMQY